MENPSLGFVGIFIPRELWLRADLTITEKVLAGVIDALDRGTGCWASNSYLADTLGVGERQIREYLGRLEQANVVRRWSTDGQRMISTIYSTGRKDPTTVEEKILPPRLNTATNSIGDNIKYINNRGDASLSIGFVKLKVDLDAVAEKAFKEFLDHRKEIKRPLTQRALEGNIETVKSEAIKHGLTFGAMAKEMVDASIRSGWYGLFPTRKAGATKKPLTSEDHKGGF